MVTRREHLHKIKNEVLLTDSYLVMVQLDSITIQLSILKKNIQQKERLNNQQVSRVTVNLRMRILVDISVRKVDSITISSSLLISPSRKINLGNSQILLISFLHFFLLFFFLFDEKNMVIKNGLSIYS